MNELLIPAKITKVTTVDPGEIRVIELTLPKQFTVDHVTYSVQDSMRPGTAFLTKPFGARTKKTRRRMYTRSNCSSNAELRLETIINYTHEEKADTSLWWQTDEVLAWQQNGTPIGVRVDWNDDRSRLTVYENSHICLPTNLRLEPDGEWEGMRFLGMAFSTGITPFLSHLRYMQESGFGRTHTSSGSHYTLVASARYPRQLLNHDELLELERQFPENFRYHPVLTREWPDDWVYTKGRIIQTVRTDAPSSRIVLSPLLKVIRDIDRCHVRMCGNREARDQLQQGIAQLGLTPLSFRAEVW